MKNNILLISRPVDDKMKGTGVSASTFWLMKNLRASGFSITEPKAVAHIPTHHSISSILFYDFVLPVYVSLTNWHKSWHCVFIADVAQAPLIFIIKKIFFRNTPVITLIADYFDPAQSRTGLYSRYLNTLTRFALRYSDYVICTAEENKKDLEQIRFRNFSPKIVVLTLGLTIQNSDTITPKESHAKGQALTLGYLGSSHPRKRLDRVLRIAQICEERKLPLSILLAGNISKDFIEKLRVISKDFVTFKNLGNITESEKVNYYADIDAFLFPTQLEGFGLPIIESHLYFRPCLIMKSAIIPAAVRKGCIEMKDDLSDFTDVYQMLTVAPDHLRGAIEENHRYAKTFDWSNYVEFFRRVK